MAVQYLVILSEQDPVASALAEEWGTRPSIGEFVDGVALRRLGPTSLLLRRPGPHIHDERLDARLPPALRAARVPLLFPSIHRSERGVPALTVHPLGNPGGTADFGGQPRTLAPTAPRLMTSTLRALAEEDRVTGLPVSFEATHHGPTLEQPAFFVEIGYASESTPPTAAVRLLARVIPRLSAHEADRVAMGVGGGHYAPHFTDLALRRHWAFGHILSRHAIDGIDATTAEAAFRATPAADGILFSRAEDAPRAPWPSVAPRLKDNEAAERPRRSSR